MKAKYLLIGIIIGVLVAISSTAIADGVSKIGKKITAEYNVKLNGEDLPVKAVALDGTSYAPVRAMGEALGLDVDFVDGEVLLNSIITEPLDFNKLSKEGLELQKNDFQQTILFKEYIINQWNGIYPNGIPDDKLDQFNVIKNDLKEAKQKLIEIQTLLDNIETDN